MSKLNEILFFAPTLQSWADDGLPVFDGQEWSLIDEKLFSPLLSHCVELYVFPSGERFNASHPMAKSVKLFVEENTRSSDLGGLVVENPQILLENPLSRYFWVPVRFGYGMSKLMVFRAGSAARVLEALSFTQFTGEGPIHCSGKWKERDKIARNATKSGDFAVVSDGMAFKLYFPDSMKLVVKDVADLIDTRWERCGVRPGELWVPDVLYDGS